MKSHVQGEANRQLLQEENLLRFVTENKVIPSIISFHFLALYVFSP